MKREQVKIMNKGGTHTRAHLKRAAFGVVEAVGIQWNDFDGKILNVQRRIYEGQANTLKTKPSKRFLPIPSALMERLEILGRKGPWVFISENKTPVNYANALKRYIRPVARELGIALGGFHDLRHTLATDLIKNGGRSKGRVRNSRSR